MAKERLSPFAVALISFAAVSFAAALVGISIGWFSVGGAEGNTVYGLFEAEGELLTVRIFAVFSVILAGISAMTTLACAYGAARSKFYVRLIIGVLTVAAASITLGLTLAFVEGKAFLTLSAGGYLLPIGSMLCGIAPLPAKKMTL